MVYSGHNGPLKNRVNQPWRCVSARLPVPEYSIRAFATRFDNTVLSDATSCGRIMPVKRTYSWPLFNVSHFSPRTTKLPLGNTRITVTLISPLKRLLWSDDASPLNSVLPSRFADKE